MNPGNPHYKYAQNAAAERNMVRALSLGHLMGLPGGLAAPAYAGYHAPKGERVGQALGVYGGGVGGMALGGVAGGVAGGLLGAVAGSIAYKLQERQYIRDQTEQVWFRRTFLNQGRPPPPSLEELVAPGAMVGAMGGAVLGGGLGAAWGSGKVYDIMNKRED